MKLFRVTGEVTIYMLAEDRQDAEMEAGFHLDEEVRDNCFDNIFCGEVKPGTPLPESLRDYLVYRAEADTPLADVWPKAEEAKP